jgi:hypothetical protein
MGKLEKKSALYWDRVKFCIRRSTWPLTNELLNFNMSSYVTNILIKQWWRHIYEGMYLMLKVCVCLYMVIKHGQHLWVLRIVISIITTFKGD